SETPMAVGVTAVQPCPLPIYVLRALPAAAPEHGEPFAAVLDDVRRVIMPGLTHWQHPSFFAYFPANTSGPAVIGDLLSSGLGVQGMLWATSPACTELETRVTDWMARAMGLPEVFLAEPQAPAGRAPTPGPSGRPARGGGVIQGTASESTLVALLAAVHRLRRADARAVPTVYCSHQAHSSVVKAAMVAGLTDPPGARDRDGGVRVRQVQTNADWSIDADALDTQIRADLASGLQPAMVCATLGTTGVMAFDDLRTVGAAIDSSGTPHPVWLHADAAMAGAAFVCPEHRGPLAGAGRLDSLCFNPHKWLLTTFDCGLLWVRDRGALADALSVTPEYLRNAASDAGEVTDYRDWQVPLGRRFRALKLWLVVRHYGLAGLRAHVRHHLSLAAWLEDQVRSGERFRLAAPRHPGSPLVCFRLRGEEGTPRAAEELNRRGAALLEAVNASGRAFLSHTTLPDPRPGFPPAYAVRAAIGGTFTRREHVEALWELLSAHAA
ncbi:MAG: hypothetical protein K2Q09_06295, partial [Phycisphaerales bacterium]|nr:hypothetical protein [Phycisphaerales bacterium]